MEMTLWFMILASMFTLALALAINYRLTIVFITSVICLPFVAIAVFLKFVIQVASCFSQRQIEQGRYTILIKVVTKSTYFFYLIYDIYVEEFNRILMILTGDEHMAIQIQRPGTPVIFTPSNEKEGDPDATRISMTKLPATRRAKIRDGVVGLKKGKVNKFRSNTVALQLVLEQMSGWENVRDGDRDIEFDSDEPINSFDLLPVDIQEELLEEFGSSGEVEEEDEDALVDEDDDEDIFA